MKPFEFIRRSDMPDDLETLLRYKAGNLSPQAREEVQQKLDEDPLFRDAWDGLAHVSDTAELKKRIQAIRIHSREQVRDRIRFSSPPHPDQEKRSVALDFRSITGALAAGIALLVTFYFLFQHANLQQSVQEAGDAWEAPMAEASSPPEEVAPVPLMEEKESPGSLPAPTAERVEVPAPKPETQPKPNASPALADQEHGEEENAQAFEQDAEKVSTEDAQSFTSSPPQKEKSLTGEEAPPAEASNEPMPAEAATSAGSPPEPLPDTHSPQGEGKEAEKRGPSQQKKEIRSYLAEDAPMDPAQTDGYASRYQVAFQKYSMGQYDSAFQLYQQIPLQMLVAADHLWSYAFSAYETENWEAAMAAFLRVQASVPEKEGEAMWYMAHIHLKLDQPDPARKLLKKLKKDPLWEERATLLLQTF